MKSLKRLTQTLREDLDYRNFRQAAHCSVAFLGIYTAVYSAQNSQSQIFEDSGYGPLGLISNAIAYIG